MALSVSLDSILKPMDSAILAQQNSWGGSEMEASVPLTRQEPTFLLSSKKALAAKKMAYALDTSLKSASNIAKPKSEEISAPPKPTVQEAQPEIPLVTTQNAPFKASGMDIEILLRENDLLDRRNRILEGEIAAMSHQFTQQKESLEHNAKVYADAEGYISQLQQQLSDAEVKMNQMIAEGENVKEEFAHSRKQHEHTGLQNRQLQQQTMEQESKIEALRHGLEEVTAKYQSYLREVSEFSVREADLLNELESKDTNLELLRVNMTRVEFQNSSVSQDNERLQDVCQTLETRIADMEEEAVHQAEDMKKIKAQEEDAILEVKKAAFRDEIQAKEIQRLSRKLEKVAEQLRAEFESQIESTRLAQKEERRKYVETINALEMKCASLQVNADRSLRDKHALQSDNESITKRALQESDRYLRNIQEISARIIVKEREASEHQQALHKSQHLLAATSTKWEVEKQGLERRNELTYARTRKLEQEVVALRDAHSQVLQEHSRLNEDYQQLLEAKKTSDIQNSSRMVKVQEELRQEAREQSDKFAHIKQSYDTLLRDHQSLLLDQRLLSEKWTAEAHSMKQRYESNIQNLRSENLKLGDKIRELESHNKNLVSQFNEILEQLHADKTIRARLELQVREADRRLADLQEREKQIIKRESNVAHEKKRLELASRKQLALAEFRQSGPLPSRKPASWVEQENYVPIDAFDGKSSPDKAQYLMAEINRLNQRSRAQEYDLKLKDLETEVESTTDNA